MISIKQKGTFKKTSAFLKDAVNNNKRIVRIMNIYGKKGVEYLALATPVDTGKTSRSWTYSVETVDDKCILNFSNENIQNGTNIALILQYGHGTANGVYVQGRDYINPALKSVFDSIADDVWKEATKR